MMKLLDQPWEKATGTGFGNAMDICWNGNEARSLPWTEACGVFTKALLTCMIEAMEEAGIAVKLDDPVWLDKEGNETEKDKVLSRQATHCLIHPDYVIFIDEVGCNTSQAGDRHIGKLNRSDPKNVSSNKCQSFYSSWVHRCHWRASNVQDTNQHFCWTSGVRNRQQFLHAKFRQRQMICNGTYLFL